MKNFIKIIVLVLFFIPQKGWGQIEGNSSMIQFRPSGYFAPNTSGISISEMQKIDGIFPVYTNGNQYFLEISDSLLNQELLISGMVTEGNGCGRVLPASSIVVLRKDSKKNQLNLYREIHSDIMPANKDRVEICRAVEFRSLQTIYASFPIVCDPSHKKKILIDITRDLFAEGGLFNRNGLEVNPMVKTFVKDVKACPTGAVFKVYFSQLVNNPMMGVIDGSFTIEWGIHVLSNKKVCLRRANPKIGYWVSKFDDYGASTQRVLPAFFIRRWNIIVKPEDEKKYERGELVVPESPIFIYLSKDVPISLHLAVRKGILEWEKAFQKIGFKDVFVICEGEAQALLAPNQITISYKNDVNEGFNFLTNPRTNEILGATILLSEKNVQQLTQEFLLFCGDCFPEIQQDPFHPAVRAQIVQARTAYFIGRCLGLSENFIASVGYSVSQLRNQKWVKSNGIAASVLDGCVFNSIVQPEDSFKLEDFFAKVSHYDYFALEYGYKLFLEGVEKEELAKIIKRTSRNTFLHFSSEKRDCRVVENDLGNNRCQAAMWKLKNLDRFMQKADLIAKNWYAGDDCWEGYIQFVKAYQYWYVNTVIDAMKDLGGVYFEEGGIGIPSRELQNEIMIFVKYLLDKTLLVDSRFKSLTGIGEFDFTQYLGNAIGEYLGEVLGKFSKQPGDGENMISYMEKLNRLVFHDFSKVDTLAPLEKRCQCAFLTSFLMNVVDKVHVWTENSIYATNILVYIKFLYQNLRELAELHEDIYYREHYQILAKMLGKGMKGLSCKK